MNIYSWIRYGLDVTVQSLNWQEWLTGIHGWLVLEGAKNDRFLRYYDLNLNDHYRGTWIVPTLPCLTRWVTEELSSKA